MFYISHVLKSQVRDSSDKVVGRLHDILIEPRAGHYAPLVFLLVKHRKSKSEFYIPYEYVENLSKEGITLKGLANNIPKIKPKEEMVFLVRDVLDQQIVDMGGARVVRVNDLRLGLFAERMSVLGIDVSFKGLMRRLGVPFLDFFDVFKVHLIDWRKAQPIKGMLKLDTVAKDLTSMHPADLANVIESLNVRQGSKLVKSMDIEAAAKVLEEMDPEAKKIFVKNLGPERASKILEKMSVDEIVDVLQLLRKDEAEQFLTYLKNGKLSKVEKLIHYSEDTAGGLMTLEYLSARPEWTVKQMRDEIQKVSANFHNILYIYVTDEEGYFKGAISLRRILVAKSDDKLKSLLKKLPESSVLKPQHKIDVVIKIMTKYNLYSAAVVDNHKKLLGIVSIDDVMRRLAPNA